MKSKLLILTGVALAAAGLSTFIFYHLVSAQAAAAVPQTAPQRPVFTAVRDLPTGARLAPEDLRLALMPVEAVPADAVEVTFGGVLVKALPAGAILTRSRLPSPEQSGASAAIPLGFRAVTVHVADLAGAAGLVKAGDRLDLLRIEPAVGDWPASMNIALENVEVLATDRELDERQRRGEPALTVLVPASEAAAVAAADEERRLRLALRNPAEANRR